MLALSRLGAGFRRLSEPEWRRIAVGLIAIVICVQVGRVVVRPQGDFHLHWRFGGRLVAGEFLYATNGLDLPYLPFWAVAHAPLSFLPMHVAQILLLPVFGLAAYGLFRVLSRLSSRAWPANEVLLFWATMITVLLASRFLIRDVLECGVNLALVALSWGAVWFWRQRRDAWGGCCLALAIALKLTPALFLAWFAWKRQWKIVFVTLLVTTGLFLSPLAFMDKATFVSVHRVWWFHASRGLLAENPAVGVLGEESIQNVSLRPALGRLLMHLPEGHNARFDHPWAVRFLDLSPQAAGWVVRLLTAALVLFVAWRFRRAVRQRTEAALLWEAAAVSVLILLLSPLTWGQHCVGVIPAVYFLTRDAFEKRALSRSAWAVLVGYAVFILVLNRGVIGKQGTYLLDSYYTTTWCLLALLGLVFQQHRQAQSQAEPRAMILPFPSGTPVESLAKAA